jgi:orotidine-5'-phosphate decarboxylase
VNNPLIVALDFPSMEEVKTFLQPFQNETLFVKVGMELYYQEGPVMIAYLKEQGHQIFLDLKLHDIPNTVKQAMKGLSRLGVDLVNVHAAGGTKMMEAALEGLEAGTEAGKQRPYCIAVTQLTSTSEQMLHEQLLIERSMEETVLHYASLAKASGLDGVVCSAKEVPFIREHFGEAFLAVTPGIRFAADEKNDQVRVVTPYEAKQLGASAIVVGRSITKTANPYAAYQQLQREWNGE